MYDLRNEKIKRRVVIYARVSTEHEAQLYALDNQIDWYKSILNDHPEWTLVEQYIDEGITGTSAKKRPKFMKMIRDAKKHKFDMIITREVSRFARNTVDTLQYTRLLRTMGVEVFFINDNIRTFDGDGELRLTIMATLAQDESRKTSIRVKAGQQTSMNNGVLYGNGNILGYDRVGKELVVNPEQAQTVRMIYDMYLDGRGLTQIKYELERLGRLTAMGKSKWFASCISAILNNPFYCGIIKYHKEYTPDFLEQRKVKNFGAIDFTYVKGKHEAIVTEEEYQRVQKIMDERRNKIQSNIGINDKKPRGHAPMKTAWGRLLICHCGKKFNRRVWNRQNGVSNPAYLCYSSTNHGTIQQQKNHGISTEGSCDSPMIPEWKLNMMAVRIFSEYIADADKVIDLASQMLEKHIADRDDVIDNTDAIVRKQKELEKLNKKMDNYLDMRSDGEISKEIFLAKTDEIQKKMKQLKDDILTLQPKEEPKVERDYAADLARLRVELESYTNFENETVIPDSILEAFIERIVVYKDSFDWYLRINRNSDNTTSKEYESEFEEAVSIIDAPDTIEQSEDKLLVASFVLTIEDAKKYMYNIDTKKRVHRWKNITVNLYT